MLDDLPRQPRLPQGNMTAFPKSETCSICRDHLSWEWVPHVLVQGRTLAGTGTWQRPLLDGACSSCYEARERERQQLVQQEQCRNRLVQLLGGEKPYREFTFDGFEVAAGNRLAFDRARAFDPTANNLYLWGPCGVGKTHLASAAARACLERGQAFEILTPPKLTRKTRMREPDAEQTIIDSLVRLPVLVLDDFGIGSDTPYFRQVLQELLDKRQNQDRHGLLVTSPYSPPALSERMADDTIPSRLFGICDVVEINGEDYRLHRR